MRETEVKSDKLRCLFAINILVCTTVLVLPILMPKDERVAVIMPPWSDPGALMRVIADAGGALVNGGRADWIAVATSQSSDFVSKLYDSGAMIVIDGSIAAACL